MRVLEGVGEWWVTVCRAVGPPGSRDAGGSLRPPAGLGTRSPALPAHGETTPALHGRDWPMFLFFLLLLALVAFGQR